MKRREPNTPTIPAAWIALGMDETQWAEAREAPISGARPYRVAIEAQAHFALVSAHEPEPQWAELSGRLRDAQKSDPLMRPGVGDFVLAQPGSEGGQARIQAILSRRTRFVRRSARRDGPQLVAANVDRVLVVTSPNDDFSPRRLERYLATVHASGAEPALVLNKLDLVEGPEPWLDQMKAVARDAPVVSMSALEGRGVEQLERLLVPGGTIALVGSSGVGKSSLVNRLLGTERQRVAEIRAQDAKGRHTTTHRELLRLPPDAEGGERGLLVDTPGMRALGLWVDPSALETAFADVAEAAQDCRFRDCRHDREPGCAVKEATEAGQLSPGRVASYLALKAESASLKPRR